MSARFLGSAATTEELTSHPMSRGHSLQRRLEERPQYLQTFLLVGLEEYPSEREPQRCVGGIGVKGCLVVGQRGRRATELLAERRKFESLLGICC